MAFRKPQDLSKMCRNCEFQHTMPRYAMEISSWAFHPHTCLGNCICDDGDLHVPEDSQVTWTHEYTREKKIGPENAPAELR